MFSLVILIQQLEVCAYSSHIRQETQVFFQTENRESKRWFASCLTLRFSI